MKSINVPAIGKYDSLKENAVFTRIKLGAWTFIIIGIFMVIGSLVSDTSISIPVSPTFDYPQYDTAITTYGNNLLKLSGNLEIKQPTIYQRLLLPQRFIEFDVLNSLLVISISVLILRLLPHIHSSVLFQTDISKSIRLIGFILIIFWLLDILRIFAYTLPEISRLTHHQFIYHINSFMLAPVPFWLGITVLWIGRIYKNAFNLKQEQQLTI